MKNKFMTKALAVVLSASMALSLSSATALTANAAAAPKLAKKTVSVKAGKKAKNKLKAASYKAGWRITKATVKKTAVAKAKVKKNKKVVVVTGVKKGATKIVLKLKNAKTGAAKKLKFKAKVKAVETPIEEPVVEDVATVTAAKQTEYDSVDLTFDRAVDATVVTNETVAINGSVGASTSVTVSGNTATVKYGYAENTEYTFSVTGINGSASITTGSYAVTDIKLADQTFEADNDAHVVDFGLLAGDVDVTKYGTYLADVQVDFAENYTSVSEAPTKPTVTFAEPDMVATVTIKYNNGKDPEISKTAKLTSVKPVATSGSAHFATVLKKWYLVDDSQDTFEIFTNAGDQKLYFYSKNPDTGKAVVYTDIEVTTSNENAATASGTLYADGKYAEITVSPTGEVGTVKFTVIATEAKGTENPTKEYTFTYKITEKNNTLNKIDIGTSTARPYNGYYGNESKFKMQPQNSIGQKLDDDAYDYTVEVSGGKEGSIEPTWTWGSVDSDGNKGLIINSLGATAGTYSFKVTISDINNDKELTAKATVTVQDALAGLFEKSVLNGELKRDADGNIDIAASKIALETKDLSITDYQGATTEGEMKVAVYVKSKPVGYLTTTGIAGYDEGETIAKYAVAAKLKDIEASQVDLYGFHVYVFNGSNYYCNVNNDVNGTMYLGVLLDGKTNLEYVKKDQSESGNSMLVGKKYSIYTSTNNMVQPVYFYGASSKKNTLAAAGKYSAVLKYNTKDKLTFADGQQIATGSFNVSYSVTMPKVEYNLSESVDPSNNFIVADVDLVRAADGASVFWCVGAKDSTKPATIQGEKFTQSVPSSGSKVYGVMVQDYRGGGWWNAAEYADYVGGQDQGNILFNFMYEMSKSVKA